MATIDLGHHGTHGQPPVDLSKPPHERYHAAQHYIDREHEFDAVKMGIWLFLATEVLLFSGMFCAYAILRMWHPEAFIGGSSLLIKGWGLLNTIVLLLSSYTVASAVRHTQTGNLKWLKINIAITFLCGLAFLVIKGVFEYWPKIQKGELPGRFFTHAHPTSEYEPLWWGVYWGATGIHASHVLVGMGLFTWLYIRAKKLHFGPGHYNAVEGVGLYWHIVDIVWIFLFPLLYLIH